MTDTLIVLLAVLALATTGFVFRRDEDALARLWTRLHSRREDDLRRDIALLIEAQDELIKSQLNLGAAARAAGTPLAVARLHEQEIEARDQRRALGVIQRMLAATRHR